METNRLEAFSDGVLAIIITIMVLEFELPAGDGLADLLAIWPTFAAYFVSFFFIAIYWVNHHQLMHMAETVNLKVLWCNIAWLFVMSFIPFLTAWVAAHPDAYVPLCVYYGDMVLACVTFHIMIYLLMHENGEEFVLRPRSYISLAVYLLAAVLGGFCPVVSFLAVSVVSCLWIAPGRGLSKE